MKNFLMHLKAFFHPIMLIGVRIVNRMPIKIVCDENESRPQQAIYVLNHTNGHDFPIAARIVRKHFYILADYTMKKDHFVDLMNRLNGCVYVDRLSRESRMQAKNNLISLLGKFQNILLFPEGTWNLTPANLLLPLNWGVIDLAKISGVPILPFVILYVEDSAYVSIGKAYHPTGAKKNEIMVLEEKMSTLLWNLMDWLPHEQRSSIPDDYYQQFLEKQLSTFKKFDLEYESSVIRKR